MTAGPILDTWLYHVETVHRHVFIATYGCHPTATPEIAISAEHTAATMFGKEELASLNLPAGYRRSIENWFSHPGHSRRQPPP